MRNGYYVYILECADGTYYVGMTNNMDRRFVEHEEGLNEDAYTFSRRPLKLAWAEKYLSVRLAYQIERKLKKWSAKKKKALIEGRFEDLKELAKCKNETTHERLQKNDTKRKRPSGPGPRLRSGKQGRGE
jgi:putative endonuclease